MIFVWGDFVRTLKKLQNVYNANPFRPCNVAKTHFFIIFFVYFLKGRGTILLNSVILKENIDMNIGHTKKVYIHNHESVKFIASKLNMVAFLA